jgi:hypothetical protein
MLGNVMLPAITVVFKNNGSNHILKPSLRADLRHYITTCYNGLEYNRQIVERIQRPIVAFGASRELLYLYNNTTIRSILSFIIDDTPAKQKQTMGGKKIVSSAIVPQISDTILISAFAHVDILTNKIRQMGFVGDIINYPLYNAPC